MTRTVAALLCTLFAGIVFAQSAPNRAPHGLVVFVRDPSGSAVDGATGTLRCPPENALIALRDLPAARFAALGGAVAVTGTSDATGKLRFATETPRAGSGLVTTSKGLGALIARLRPGSTPRIVMQPMAEVVRKGGGNFRLWARHTTATGESVELSFVESDRVRLPPGEYETWARSGDEWLWQRLVLGSSQRHDLEFVGAEQRIASRDSAWIHAAHWPDVCLVEPGASAVLIATTAIPLSAGVPDTGAVTIDRTLPPPTSAAPIPWPPAATGPSVEFSLTSSIESSDAITTAELFLVQRTDSGSWRVVGASRADPNRRFRLPAPPAGDTWLLLVAAEHAPLALPFSVGAADSKLTPSRGQPLVVRATDERGDPVVDLVVDWVPRDGDAATVRAHTGAQGHANVGRVTAPGTLFVSDERFANQEIAVDVVPRDGVALSVHTGAAIEGRVVLADGSPAAGAVVTVRDSSGRLRPAARSAVTANDGKFVFAGLPVEREFVVFATIAKDRRTWSGRRAALRAGGDSFDVVVQNEDPELRPR